jgi:hypothetical protein
LVQASFRGAIIAPRKARGRNSRPSRPRPEPPAPQSNWGTSGQQMWAPGGRDVIARRIAGLWPGTAEILENSFYLLLTQSCWGLDPHSTARQFFSHGSRHIAANEYMLWRRWVTAQDDGRAADFSHIVDSESNHSKIRVTSENLLNCCLGFDRYGKFVVLVFEVETRNNRVSVFIPRNSLGVGRNSSEEISRKRWVILAGHTAR